ncbi:SDR family NAD(P)-dependent oxidoreductase [Marinicrinis sediminis]|uniref:SDR family NAD(P)-dependent oxidoreductase n=1 Tax=Marinicrinis sediminis TaxID=1652465 RepID=A0ABW5RG68_9BACL
MTQTVLITGASGGIGLELAREFAAAGHTLILTARSGQKLEQAKQEIEQQYGVPVALFVHDLAKPAEIEALWTSVQEAGWSVDILVNNAGYGLFGPFAETDLQDELNMIDLNVRSLTQLTKLALQDMVKKGRGRILNVASTAAFQPGPLMAVYYATKAFVLSFSEALAKELEDHGITVTALCPGATATGFEERANLQGSGLLKSGVMDARTVARIGYDGTMRGKRVVIPGWRNRMLAQSVRFMPRKLVTTIVKKIQQKS